MGEIALQSSPVLPSPPGGSICIWGRRQVWAHTTPGRKFSIGCSMRLPQQQPSEGEGLNHTTCIGTSKARPPERTMKPPLPLATRLLFNILRPPENCIRDGSIPVDCFFLEFTDSLRTRMLLAGSAPAISSLHLDYIKVDGLIPSRTSRCLSKQSFGDLSLQTFAHWLLRIAVTSHPISASWPIHPHQHINSPSPYQTLKK